MSERRWIRVGVEGASGYGGGELIRLLHAHPAVEGRSTAAGADFDGTSTVVQRDGTSDE